MTSQEFVRNVYIERLRLVDKYFEVNSQTDVSKMIRSLDLDAPIFEHYHRPTDTFDKLSEDSIRITSSAIWETIVMVQKNNW